MWTCGPFCSALCDCAMEQPIIRAILMFGPPGCGKGTQGKAVGNMPGYRHLACGDVFRSLDVNSDLGKTFLQYSSRGLLVPDELTVELWRQHVATMQRARQFDPARQYLVLDGIPRNLAQARLMQADVEPVCILWLDVPDREALVQRMRRRALQENRLDDAKEEVIRDRFSVFDRETRPVLELYPARLVHQIDGDRAAIAVLAEIAAILSAIPAPERATTATRGS